MLARRSGPLPVGDTPLIGDIFDLYDTTGEDFLRVSCAPSTASCDNFTFDFLKPVEHEGPYQAAIVDLVPRRVLQISRVNEACLTGNPDDPAKPCGDVELTATNIPEPASVLLVGIGKTFLDDYYTRMSAGISLKAVSYTHLTLPTSDLV